MKTHLLTAFISRPWLYRCSIAAVGLLIAGAIIIWTLPSWLAGPSSVAWNHSDHADSDRQESERDGLRVITFNAAHGRGSGGHQAFRANSDLIANIDRIGSQLLTLNPDVVALQEIDLPSWWTGNHDQIGTLETITNMHRVEGHHVQGLGLNYGAALLVRMPIKASSSHRFPVHWPTWPKGYVVATSHWPGRPDRTVTVVSAHLDFASEATRAEQITHMIAHLANSNHPLIVMGDLNDQFTPGSPTQRLMESLDLHTWQPFDPTPAATFPSNGKRIDWTLVSKHFSINNYQVLNELPSDHQAVLIDLTWIDDHEPAAASIAPGK